MVQPWRRSRVSPAKGPDSLCVVGLMSGTSHDAVDAAACDLRLDGGTLLLTPRGHVSVPYPAALRSELVAALPPARTTIEQVCRLDTGIGQAFADVARRAVAELCDGRADLVVSHGQTVYHWVDDGAVRGTLQIGEAAWIAEATGLPVVSGLRTRDVAAGGQGAPLVGLFDALWLAGRPGAAVALNLGGIANVTVPTGDGGALAFDTGPACALLDAATRHVTGDRLTFDADGALAARGRVAPELLARLLDDPYYARPAPKSTGKELFHLGYVLDRLGPTPPSAEDLLATLVALTARTVADAIRDGVTEVVASGGGTRNPVLMAALREELPGVAVRTSDELGVPSQAKEALAFAVLGWHTWHGLPGVLPGATGARHVSVLGSVTPGAGGVFPPGAAAGADRPGRLEVVRC
ncbi:anhydro-N-acetylmuramic acid kinase [Promicromonospora thailandica]|uniref:Anhydro-N-acetylmuramic acid kinase n=1 Tax=Promicromonospora thailandica TaxID=765201 RepID=A0A9X2G9S0_9MICO|nr:anhydro-N-acetylmuramic acid kinase [Promicromonospora thailandica]MCP2265241.1 anhydro-N-acetylmuramic acid kinase [Promicromonospora thailandica]